MKKSKGFFIGLTAVCVACLITAASCSQSSQPNPGFTAGRTGATLIAVVGLVSTIIGILAFRSAGRDRSGKRQIGSIGALVLGLFSIILSVVHLGTSTGGFGTGSGRAGAIVALVLGLIGVNLGGLAQWRTRCSRSTD